MTVIRIYLTVSHIDAGKLTGFDYALGLASWIKPVGLKSDDQHFCVDAVQDIL